MDLNNETILTKYKPLSPWAYFGYNILFSIPVIGFILLIVFSFSNDNINRRNYARSFFCNIRTCYNSNSYFSIIRSTSRTI